ncbi:MAG: hypothetical protein LBS43_11065 [Prevotellaceae bacterium]|nr:hypothetical protein [Prevotellaceae bacterium]
MLKYCKTNNPHSPAKLAGGFYVRILWISIIFTVFASCNKDEVPEPVRIERTVIVYMAADNDLWDVALVDLEEMKQGYNETGVNLIVLMDVADETPCLLRITEDGEQTVKTYSEFNSADPANMNRLLGEIIEMYPSDSYGLILWSHGKSWLPAGVETKSFVMDGNRQMNIPDLAEALPVRFDFILFDACLMGAVEVAYELRNKTDYIIASSAETIDSGFPYDLVIPALVSSTPDLRKAAESFFDYYQEQSGAFRSATISLINTKELDNLARVTNQLISEQTFDIASFDRTSVQRLDVYEEQYTFDFLDFITKAFPEADKRPLIEQLEKTALYKAHTAEFIEMYEINTYCGLSCYIPHIGRNDLTDYYKQLGWYQAGGYNKLF